MTLFKPAVFLLLETAGLSIFHYWSDAPRHLPLHSSFTHMHANTLLSPHPSIYSSNSGGIMVVAGDDTGSPPPPPPPCRPTTVPRRPPSSMVVEATTLGCTTLIRQLIACIVYYIDSKWRSNPWEGMKLNFQWYWRNDLNFSNTEGMSYIVNNNFSYFLWQTFHERWRIRALANLCFRCFIPPLQHKKMRDSV